MTSVTDNASNMTKAFEFLLPCHVKEKKLNADDSSSDSEDSADPSATVL